MFEKEEQNISEGILLKINNRFTISHDRIKFWQSCCEWQEKKGIMIATMNQSPFTTTQWTQCNDSDLMSVIFFICFYYLPCKLIVSCTNLIIIIIQFIKFLTLSCFFADSFFQWLNELVTIFMFLPTLEFLFE